MLSHHDAQGLSAASSVHSSPSWIADEAGWCITCREGHSLLHVAGDELSRGWGGSVEGAAKCCTFGLFQSAKQPKSVMTAQQHALLRRHGFNNS